MSARARTDEAPPSVVSSRHPLPAEPARRIVIGSLAILFLLAAAIGVTIWRYESALGKYQNETLSARDDAERVGDAVAAFWREQAFIFSYVLQQSDQVLLQLDEARKDFVQSLNGVHVQTRAEGDLRNRALTANN